MLICSTVMAGRIYRGGARCSMPDQSASSKSQTGCRFYARETNDPSLEPAPLLKRLAAEGKSFASLAQTASGRDGDWQHDACSPFPLAGSGLGYCRLGAVAYPPP